MPRVARVKSELDLFKEDSDKLKYLSLIKGYQRKYQFKVYAYCLMDNHGHLFQDRFKSKIVTYEKYLITLSSYIHNNPKDIPKYEDKVENYGFSSLKEYIKGTNNYEILDLSFLNIKNY
ncbi:transposase [Tepidibacter aestuarii]|uniref:transposase n=1 Tax=Tepidibacter aestuarii TaxID=2925782 RepID=UPI0020C0EF08|nr:transposase [Tepidibacter aestuarii]CAH2213912.1 transposase [Tepidibacter aestuarii]